MDNYNLQAKLDLRRHFLAKYHREYRADVLDCCQGGGKLWSVLRQEFPVTSYWGLDLKPKPGRLKIDSVRVLQQPGWTQNVIDVDTYGLPWKHWLALLPNVSQSLTVFLTFGSTANGMGSKASEAELQALGLMAFKAILPASFTLKLIRKISDNFLLAESYRFGINIVEAVEAVSDGNARYIGVRLEKASGVTADNSGSTLNATEAERSYGHV